MQRVLIVDDDQGLVSLLQRFLQNEGFEVQAAFDHRSGLDAALTGEYDAVILDVMLPGGSGFELLKSLRAQSRVPVLLLTARGESVDRILGLEIGADDYVPKPFDPRELVARIRAVLRRSPGSHGDGASNSGREGRAKPASHPGRQGIEQHGNVRPGQRADVSAGPANTEDGRSRGQSKNRRSNLPNPGRVPAPAG